MYTHIPCQTANIYISTYSFIHSMYIITYSFIHRLWKVHRYVCTCVNEQM